MKACSKCGLSKPFEDFHRYSRSTDGRRTNCKKCAAAYNRRWHAENREHKRQYHLARREDRLRQMAEYRQRNLEALRAYDRERQRRDRVARAEYLRHYYRENIEKRREYLRANPEGNRLNQRRRKALKRGYKLQPADREYMKILLRDPCAYCGEGAGTIDHIEPLGLTASGEWSNLTAACRRCNSSKSTRDLLGFLLMRS